MSPRSSIVAFTTSTRSRRLLVHQLFRVLEIRTFGNRDELSPWS
jgi:hypothetical protein